MNISKDYPTRAVGYTRVSTEKQAANARDRDSQTESIIKACARRGMTLLGIYHDVLSGADPQGALRREDLQAAVKRARAERAILVINEPTRLFRNVAAAEEFLKTLDVPVFSVRDGRFMKKRALLNAIARGEAVVQNIRTGTSEALARKKSEGVVFSDQPGRVKAAQVSAKARTERANRLVLDIVRVLKTHPSARGLSHQALADLLNEQNILTGRKKRWTRDGVRRPRQAAQAVLTEWEEIENDDTVGIPLDNMGREITSPVQPADLIAPVDSDDPDGELPKNPLFGMFGNK